MNKSELLRKIQDHDERIAVSKVLDQFEKCDKNHEKTFTDFLNPTEANHARHILQQISFDTKYAFFGGFGEELEHEEERQIIGFYKDYDEIEDFPITLIEITHNEKFQKELTHRDYLGSIVGLGISRGKVGDIVIGENGTYLAIKEDMADFLLGNLTKIGRSRIMASVTTLDKLDIPFTIKEEMNINVASCRIDAILAATFNISRGKIQDLIDRDKAFINWTVITNQGKSVANGDIITLRGKGRLKIIEIKGTTKKGRQVITIVKY